MEKVNPLFDKAYPEWKKTLWGMLRAFIGAFIPTAALMFTAVTIEDFKSKETLIKLLTSVAVAGIAAGVVGIGKYLRALFPESVIVAKLPF